MCVTHALGSGRSRERARCGPKYSRPSGSCAESYLAVKSMASVPWIKGLGSWNVAQSKRAVRESMMGGDRSGIGRTVSFVLAVVALYVLHWTVVGWAFVIAAVILPYVAVVAANSDVRKLTRRG